MTSTLTPYDALQYCSKQEWTVVGYELKLLVRQGETVTVAVLARDHLGHFLAVSPLDLDDRPGIGVIDLNTAESRFVEGAGSLLAN